MTEPATIHDLIVFVAACTVIGGLILVLAGLAANAMGRDDGHDDAEATARGGAIDADVSRITASRDDGSFVCLCSHETRDDGRGEWDSVDVIDVVNEKCPIHGPAGQGWEFIDVTRAGDEGRMRCIRGGRKARSI